MSNKGKDGAVIVIAFIIAVIAYSSGFHLVGYIAGMMCIGYSAYYYG